jgi:hypothetical protein
MNDERMSEYETPEIFELGEAETLTQGSRWGDWPDHLSGVGVWVFREG